MTKKRIAIFIYSLGPGGAERVTTTLATHLQEEFEVTIVLLKELVAYPLPEGIRVVCAPPSSSTIVGKVWGMVKTLFWFKTWCEHEKITTVLAILNRPIWISSLAKFFGNSPHLLVAEHTMQSLWRKEEGGFFLLKQTMMKTLLSLPDGVIAISQEIAHDLATHYGIPSSKLHVIANPFDIKEVQRLSLLSPQRRGKVITAGTLKPLKNHAMLLDALSFLSSVPPTTLLGSGELLESLQETARKKGLSPFLSFEGFASNPYGYFATHDIFVLTSHFEGLPTVIIEAMICGCAIISTDCPSGPREILAPETDPTNHLTQGIEWGSFGVLVPVDDPHTLALALQTLLDDDDKLNHYKKMAILRANDFDQKHAIAHYSRLLKGEV